LTGLRLLMFQAFFIHTIASPKGEGLKGALASYNLQFGLPTTQQKEALFHAAKEILGVASWPAFYSRLGLAGPRGSHQQARFLRRAIEESSMCGYHTPSSKAWNGSHKARHNEEQCPPARRARQTSERVGVQVDLQRAFRNATAKAVQIPKANKACKMALCKASPTKATSKVQKFPVGLQNSFEALRKSEAED